MFGTSNVLLMTIEAQERRRSSTIPTIIKTVDRITLDLLHKVPGVNGEQVMSITHPKLKTTLTTGVGHQDRAADLPAPAGGQGGPRVLPPKVYTTEGVRGFFVSQDDKATLIIAGFWEEYFDLAACGRRSRRSSRARRRTAR